MAGNPQPDKKFESQRLFVKADEVDNGTSILSPSKQLPLSALAPPDAAAPAGTRPKGPPRPVLRRDGSAQPPPPPSQPPPAPPHQSESDMNADSLSLPQLKQLVNQFPKLEQKAYAFQYSDSQDFADEIEEWFHYAEQDRDVLLSSREAFEQVWRLWSEECEDEHRLKQEEREWVNSSLEAQSGFLGHLLQSLESSQLNSKCQALECLLYILSGVWGFTAGLATESESSDVHSSNKPDRNQWSSKHILWMHRGADMLEDYSEGLAIIKLTDTLHQILGVADGTRSAIQNSEQSSKVIFDDTEVQIISLCFTCLYLIIESGRAKPNSGNLQTIIRRLSPDLLLFLVEIISRFRWDESCNIPLMQALHLFWKLLLLLFGGIKTDLEHAKSILQPRIDPFSAEASHPKLTASPLDYHLFRQEITSKYPAYNPPLPLVPLEIEHKSMLPPLPYNSTKTDVNGIANGQGPATAPTGSIFHQPVHIATPAPSPPPSPIGPGGKTGKKQNYQTNQNFPFLYPPLDDSSNMIGGQGTTEFQDLMVGKKWEGSDIPASIIEAGELFASRMRMTRAMRQLWKERDAFLKYDRGWRPSNRDQDTGVGSDRPQQSGTSSAQISVGDEDEAKIASDTDVKERLNAVERFFHLALPNLQSLVIVMMKVMLRNVQEIAVQNGGSQEQTQAGGLNRTKSIANMAQAQSLPVPPITPQPSDLSVEDLEIIRSREISQKVISGTIFILLKWFKISHVLKFEYLNQLLLDSNYLQLTLKYFAHQNLEDLVAIKYDREELGFFHFCHLNSDHPPLSPTSPSSDSDNSSDEEPVSPPISRNRQSPSSNSDHAPLRQTASPMAIDPSNIEHEVNPSSDPSNLRPTVDELGNPLAPLPQTPITDFSFRQFQTSIHLLRILQKLTRGKAHRILLLVQFKSSQILRRILRVPDPMLRLYVLKLFKSQVPYCGRKWRQSNMRVITAIYLHCRPELRDEWLAGMHDSAVEGEVDEAVPLEWALRGLTYWWQKRTYPDVMRLTGAGKVEEDAEGGQEIADEERDFFQRELDAMGWGVAGLEVGEDVAFGEEAPGVNVVNGAAAEQQWEQGGQTTEAW